MIIGRGSWRHANPGIGQSSFWKVVSIIAGQGEKSKIRGTDLSGPLVLLSWRAMDEVGESGAAAQDPRLVMALARLDGLCHSTGSLRGNGKLSPSHPPRA